MSEIAQLEAFARRITSAESQARVRAMGDAFRTIGAEMAKVVEHERERRAKALAAFRIR